MYTTRGVHPLQRGDGLQQSYMDTVPPAHLGPVQYTISEQEAVHERDGIVRYGTPIILVGGYSPKGAGGMSYGVSGAHTMRELHCVGRFCTRHSCERRTACTRYKPA
jgi:hypothetical protein